MFCPQLAPASPAQSRSRTISQRGGRQEECFALDNNGTSSSNGTEKHLCMHSRLDILVDYWW